MPDYITLKIDFTCSDEFTRKVTFLKLLVRDGFELVIVREPSPTLLYQASYGDRVIFTNLCDNLLHALIEDCALQLVGRGEIEDDRILVFRAHPDGIVMDMGAAYQEARRWQDVFTYLYLTN
jgi:hypothetical protein